MSVALPINVEAYRDHLQHRLVERGVPEHLHRGLLAYLTERRPVGQFLTAVLSNDLQLAVLRADDASLAGLKPIVMFFVNHAPAIAWGSHQAVNAWLADPSPVSILFE